MLVTPTTLLIGVLGQDNHGKATIVEAVGALDRANPQRYVAVRARYISDRAGTWDTHSCTLDGAILAVSAIEGVDDETRIHLSELSSLDLPTVIAVTKSDSSSGRQLKAARKQIDAVLADLKFSQPPSVIVVAALPALLGDTNARAEIGHLASTAEKVARSRHANSSRRDYVLTAMGETPFYVTGPDVDRLMREQVRDALREHRIAGRSIVVWRDGEVLELAPSQIPV